MANENILNELAPFFSWTKFLNFAVSTSLDFLSKKDNRFGIAASLRKWGSYSPNMYFTMFDLIFYNKIGASFIFFHNATGMNKRPILLLSASQK